MQPQSFQFGTWARSHPSFNNPSELLKQPSSAITNTLPNQGFPKKALHLKTQTSSHILSTLQWAAWNSFCWIYHQSTRHFYSFSNSSLTCLFPPPQIVFLTANLSGKVLIVLSPWADTDSKQDSDGNKSLGKLTIETVLITAISQVTTTFYYLSLKRFLIL